MLYSFFMVLTMFPRLQAARRLSAPNCSTGNGFVHSFWLRYASMGLKALKMETSFSCKVENEESQRGSVSAHKRPDLIRQRDAQVVQLPADAHDVAARVEVVHGVRVEGVEDGALRDADLEVAQDDADEPPIEGRR